MLLLTSISDVIKLVTASALQTDVHASWMDLSSGATTPGRTNTSISTATTTTVVASPAASTYRNIKTLSIRNADSASNQVVTVQHYDGTTTVSLIKATLLAGETLQYVDKEGFLIFDNAGNIKLGPSDSKFVQATLLTNTVSSTFVTSARTNFINVRVQGAGGQGGGGLGGSSTASVGGGGGAGAYAEKWFAVSSNSSITYQCGAGGSSSSGNATGQNGGNTTVTVNGITITANGGSGGTLGGAAGSTTVIVVGGSGGTQSTNGDINGAGSPGGPGVRLSGTVACSGEGGSSYFGSGGNSVNTDVVGNNAAGYGGGGGGAASLTANARTGGSGSNGCIYIEEYT